MSKLIYITDENLLNNIIKSKEVTIINFWAKWCGPCKFINNILEELSTEENKTIYSINVDNFPSIISQFNIKNIPCIQVYQEGSLKNIINSILLKEDLRKELFNIN